MGIRSSTIVRTTPSPCHGAWSIGLGTPRFSVAATAAPAAAPAAAAEKPPTPAPVELMMVEFPEKQKVKLSLSRTGSAPAATIEATVLHESGSAEIDLSYKKLAPAILFGGDIAAYVLWAVSPDGLAQNLGEVGGSSSESGSGRYYTWKQEFALMVTAEPLAPIIRPSDLVVFTSTPPEKGAPGAAYSFTGLVARQDVKKEKDSIAGLSYKAKEPVQLVQAQRAYALAERLGAVKEAPDLANAAKATLDQANGAFSGKGGGDKAVIASSRKAVTLSFRALAETLRTRDLAARKAEAEKARAGLALLEKKAAEAEAKGAGAVADKATLEQKVATLQQLFAEATAAAAACEAKRKEAETSVAQAQQELQAASAAQQQTEAKLDKAEAQAAAPKEAPAEKPKEAAAPAEKAKEAAPAEKPAAKPE